MVAVTAIKIDMVFQKKENHFKSLLLADMDSTMIEQECIDELADMCGVGSEVKKITTRAMNGELGFHDALNESKFIGSMPEFYS